MLLLHILKVCFKIKFGDTVEKTHTHNVKYYIIKDEDPLIKIKNHNTVQNLVVYSITFYFK